MAFLFNGTSSSSTSSGQTTDDPEDGKQNIFGESAGAGGGTTSDSAQAGGGAVAKTTVDGGAVGGGGSSGGTPAQSSSGGTAAPASTGGYNPKAVSSAYGAIAKNLTLPTRSTQKAQQSLNEGEQKLQDQANAYGASAQTTAQGYKLDNDTLEGAATGDRDAYAKTSQRLTSAAPQFEAFGGLGADAPNIDSIKDTSKAYADEAGPNYTAGQSRLDQALLKRSPQYMQMQAELLGQSSALKKKSDEMATSETERQRAMLADAYKTSTDEIRNSLGGKSNEIVQAAKTKEGQEDLRRGALDPAAIATKEAQGLKAKVEDDLKHADPNSAQYRSLKFLADLPAADLAKYVGIDKDTDWTEFIDQGGAERYNRIEGLLGNSNMLSASQAGPGADYSFDQKGAYADIIAQLTGKRQAADQAGQAEINRIMAQADAASKSAPAPVGSASDRARQDLQVYASTHSTQYDPNSTLQAFFSPSSLEKLKAQGIFKTPAASTWQDYLSAEQAAQLNALGADTGIGGTYGAGTPKGPDYDISALQAAYDAYVQGLPDPGRKQNKEPSDAQKIGDIANKAGDSLPYNPIKTSILKKKKFF